MAVILSHVENVAIVVSLNITTIIQRCMNRKFLLIPSLIGIIIGSLLNYPYEFLKVEHTDEYKIYLKALEEYENYVKKYNKAPDGVEYLSEDLLALVGKRGSPLEYVPERRILVCRMRYLDGSRVSFFDYLRSFISEPGVVKTIPASQ